MRLTNIFWIMFFQYKWIFAETKFNISSHVDITAEEKCIRRLYFLATFVLLMLSYAHVSIWAATYVSSYNFINPILVLPILFILPPQDSGPH